MHDQYTYLKPLEKILESFGISVQKSKDQFRFTHGDRHVDFYISGDDPRIEEKEAVLPLDHMITQPYKIAAAIRSKLNRNATVFARSCEVKKISRETAAEFLNRYHLMNATQSAFNYGLFYKEELIAVASFSKGRKMNRLAEDQRSFELIRFCCKEGITVTGGLTRLVKNFCREKKAGDVMTYVDKQFSDGRSFVTAGFKKHSETPPNYFLVNTHTFERTPVSDSNVIFDKTKFYLGHTSGNIKMIYTLHE